MKRKYPHIFKDGRICQCRDCIKHPLSLEERVKLPKIKRGSINEMLLAPPDWRKDEKKKII